MSNEILALCIILFAIVVVLGYDMRRFIRNDKRRIEDERFARREYWRSLVDD